MEHIRRYFDNDYFARLCGIELISVSPGRATVRMAIRPDHINGYGSVQGGAIFTLADFAFAAASNSHGQVAVGINVSINYLKAAQTGTLVAEAREVVKNFRLGTYLVEVKDDAGDVVALFQGLVYRKNEAIPGCESQKNPAG